MDTNRQQREERNSASAEAPLPPPLLVVEEVDNNIYNPAAANALPNGGEILHQHHQEEDGENEEEMEPVLSEGEEKALWTTYLTEMEEGTIAVGTTSSSPEDSLHDAATIAMRDAILPPPTSNTIGVDADDDYSKNEDVDPTSSSGLLQDVVSRVRPQSWGEEEDEDWEAFFKEMDDAGTTRE